MYWRGYLKISKKNNVSQCPEVLILKNTCPANQPQTPASNRINDRIDRIELARYRLPPPTLPPSISHPPASTLSGGRWEVVGGVAVGWEVGGWEVGGGKSAARRRSLKIESIDRGRSNQFSHGMKYVLGFLRCRVSGL